MQLVVKLRPDSVPALRGRGDRTLQAQELKTAADQLGVTLRPMHPGEQDPLLAPYFTIDVSEEQDVDDIIAALQQIDAVEAAYAKPPDEPP